MVKVKAFWPAWMAGIVIGLLGLDRVTKWWALATIRPLGSQGVDPLPGLLRWVYVENRGVAFGLFQNRSSLFGVLAILIILGILWRSRSWLQQASTLGRVSVALIIAGGVGNIIDRFAYGFVVDFIHLIPLPFFQVFNVADMAISFGAVGLFITLWREDAIQRRKRASEASGG